MLKPKYVHGLNADQAPKSVLNRLQNSAGQMVSAEPSDDTDDDPFKVTWTWILG